MKILIAIASLGGGGAERTAVNLAAYWTAQGREVRLVTLASEDLDCYAVPAGVSRAALGLAHGGGAPWRRLTANVQAVAAYRREIAGFRPDVVVGLITQVNVLIALASLGLSCATVGSERISPGHWAIPRAWSFLRRHGYGLLDVVTAQTEGAAAWIRTHTRARRTEVIPNAVALPLARGDGPALDPAAVCAPGEKVLLGVGRLTEQKRFDLLIETFAELAPARPDWRLVVLGEGPDRGRLEALTRTLGVADRVRLPGRADNVADWYARASAFALCSDFEGFPNVLAEALAHGVPAVATDCPDGPRDIVRDGVDGFLVPPRDGAALAARLAALMDDEGLRRRMAQAGPDVLARFAPERVMGRWDATIERALAASNPAGQGGPRAPKRFKLPFVRIRRPRAQA